MPPIATTTILPAFTPERSTEISERPGGGVGGDLGGKRKEAVEELIV